MNSGLPDPCFPEYDLWINSTGTLGSGGGGEPAKNADSGMILKDSDSWGGGLSWGLGICIFNVVPPGDPDALHGFKICSHLEGGE